jgi:hypothetical protein
MKWLLIFALSSLLVSCAVQNTIYVWSDYKMALARYKEQQTSLNRSQLETSLSRIISESVRQKKRVPPGIYMQYGYLMATEGKIEIASQYYQLEIRTYPESSTLVHELESELK